MAVFLTEAGPAITQFVCQFCSILAVVLIFCLDSTVAETKITSDPLNIMSSWNMSVHFCQWRGISCDKRHQRVTGLNLNSQKLQGSLSPYVGNLSFLQVLVLSNNRFSLEIPAEIGNLRRLQTLYLYENLFTGQIPANLSGCTNLVAISFANNNLVGKIPAGFSNLVKLQGFNVQMNKLSGGFPAFFGNFSSLKLIKATLNNFVGSIPDSLGQLKRLSYLSMGGNMLSGTIPPSIFNISALQVLSLPVNKLRGTLPPEMGNMLPNLVNFSVGDNEFTGFIPLSLSNASNLQMFTIAINGFSGLMPSLEKMKGLFWLSISTNNLGTGQYGDLRFLDTLSNKTSLKLLSISANNFGGPLPSSITNLTSLNTLTVDFNQIFGSIPSGIGNLVNLGQLDMGNNRFTGEIPVEIGSLKQLIKLSLYSNHFSGTIPSSIGNLSLLTHLKLEENSLHGVIPPSLGKSQSLLLLNLSQNNLSGSIPKELMTITSLTISLSVSQNYLTGQLPAEVGALTNLGELDISNNMLSGGIPDSLGSCVKLEFLYMQRNSFRGSIPTSLGSLRGLQVVDLSHNNLTGNIPDFFESFHSLLRLNMSFNDLEGIVPTKGVFENSTATSVEGNSKLCGGIAEFQLPSCNIKATEKRGLSLSLKLIIAICGLLGAVLVLASLCFLFVKRGRVEPKSNPSLNLSLRTSYQILLKATDGFSQANLLGVGGFGSVYKGVLEENGPIIAVKVLNVFHPAASKSFKAECKVMRNIRHRNLVKLLTACSGFDYQGNEFKALVYEFMVNGSLEDWLHPFHGSDETQESPRKSLNFLQRIGIAMDVACALDYLHQGNQTPIVHCDLKPSNVLLNEELEGRVGDFGLARFFAENATAYNLDPSSTIGIGGTVGYAPPEYGTGNEVSTSGDVYAYGILLLEMFTGKKPTDDLFTDDLSLHSFVEAALPEQVEKLLDPILLQEIREREMDQDRAESSSNTRISQVWDRIVSIFELGLTCSAQSPSERMKMVDVTVELSTIQKALFGS
ncbi:hypothetical protein K2173_000325 [Erythroxylum novogranatense]|uniref:non-specific serine/threonine protein kinase n=1 Tax=Erythroxylum novogranatense TaxID=1862640 RepID=A0AAV8SX53_9ROSI|nr:hypothetical protein K2173_000325 [Erythroxylum novogranatense]